MKGTSKELDKVARFSTLKKEVEANVDLYNSLYGRIKEAGISAASKSVDIQVVDPARVPDDPIRPRRLMNLAVGSAGCPDRWHRTGVHLRGIGQQAALSRGCPPMDWKRQCFHHSR